MPATIKVKKVKPTSSRQYRTRSACKKPSKTNEKIEDDVDAKKIEDLKLAASLVNWSSYDKLMGKIFYDKVGKILEKKVDDFQKVKTELKTYVRENYDNQKVFPYIFLYNLFIFRRLCKRHEGPSPRLLCLNKLANSSN